MLINVNKMVIVTFPGFDVFVRVVLNKAGEKHRAIRYGPAGTQSKEGKKKSERQSAVIQHNSH